MNINKIIENSDENSAHLSTEGPRIKITEKLAMYYLRVITKTEGLKKVENQMMVRDISGEC